MLSGNVNEWVLKQTYVLFLTILDCAVLYAGVIQRWIVWRESWMKKEQ